MGFGVFVTSVGFAFAGLAHALLAAMIATNGGIAVYGTVADVVTMGRFVVGTTTTYFGVGDMTKASRAIILSWRVFQGNTAAYA